jgi:DNA-directed RNA polymerase subunit RPC12/RpoP
LDVVGVSRAKTSGSFVTKFGRKAYRGQKKHWYVYYYDDDGKFRKKMISTLEVPYYGSLIRRTKTYLCRSCDTKFRSMRQECPKCGARALRVVRTPPTRAKSATVLAGSKPSTWSYRGTFVVEASNDESTPNPP